LMLATSSRITGVSETLIAKLTLLAGICRFNGTSSRVTLVGGTLSGRSYRVCNMLATSCRIARVSETLIAKLASARGIGRFDGTSSRVTLVGGTLSGRSYRVCNMLATSSRIARVSVALVA
jgi:uncharacterized membrane protein (UPF0136 family)